MTSKNVDLVFGDNIKRLRFEKGISLRQMASDLDISFSSLNAYENGISDPTLRTARKIADYFGKTIEEMCGD